LSELTDADSPESTVAALSHLAFCALIALSLARQDGAAGTPRAENLFLTRWLATAQKQKRFPRCVAPDITLLLEFCTTNILPIVAGDFVPPVLRKLFQHFFCTISKLIVS
jgi:hypothetical protein